MDPAALPPYKFWTDPANAEANRTIADRLGAALAIGDWPIDAAWVFTRADNDGLSLRASADGPRGPRIHLDFLSPEIDRRRRGGSGDLLFRAVGPLAPGMRIFDATAGLGRDSFLLAERGARVLACERNPLIFALLEDAAGRAARYPELQRLFRDRLQFRCDDAIRVMAGWEEAPPEIVLVDPMFPDRDATALVKQEIRLLRKLVGPDDPVPLLQAARRLATRRVVVKRMHDSPPIAPDVTFSVGEKTARFDVYVRTESPNGRAALEPREMGPL